MSLPKTYKRAAFREQGGPLTVDEVPLKLPGDGQILIKVEACGVCHSDVFVQYNVWGVGFPMAPGHEIIGRVAAVGAGVEGWKAGDRVGGAWHGGQCQNCDRCKAGLIQFCEPYVVNGVTQEGGYAEYCIIRAQGAIRIPNEADAAEYAPLLCAGSTVFHALRSQGLSPGDTVAVQGLGGLGHMAVQFASKMGFRVIAISRGSDKEKSARELGAHEYIDATVGDAGQKLADLGGAKLVLTTAQDAAAMTPLIKGISLLGKLLILSILQDGTLTLNSNELLPRGISVHCWPVASCHDCEETVNFAHLQGVHSTIEKFPLEKAQDAFMAMLTGKVRYRSVITM